jgi:hypothetical protein
MRQPDGKFKAIVLENEAPGSQTFIFRYRVIDSLGPVHKVRSPTIDAADRVSVGSSRSYGFFPLVCLASRRKNASNYVLLFIAIGAQFYSVSETNGDLLQLPSRYHD